MNSKGARMFCPSCGTTLQSGQKFCTECGANVSDVTAPSTAAATTSATAATPAMPPPSPVAPTPPAAAPTPPAMPVVAPAAAQVDEAHAPTTAFTVVEQTTPGTTLFDTPPAGYDAGGVAGVAPSPGFRITPLLAVAALAGVLGVASAFVDVLTVDTTDTATGSLAGSIAYKLNDLGTSHLVGTIVGLVLLVAGGVLGAIGHRAGSGLAGGTGLALGGMLANACGIAIATADFSLFGVLPGQTVTSTFELGFFLAIGAAVLGGVAFALSLREMGADGHPPVPPVIGVLGALGALAVVVGTLLPGDLAEFGDNFGVDFLPPATTWLRLLVLLLIAVGGFLGFLVNRRWGLGLALGSISVGVWMWGTALTEAGDIPIGIAGGNLGATDVQPHLITTIGVVVMVVAGVVGLIAAAQQRRA